MATIQDTGTQIIVATFKGTETAEKAMQTIERNTRAQIKLVEDLLDVSRIVAGKLLLELKTVSPGDVVR